MEKKNITLTILLTNLFIAFLGIGLVIPVTPIIMNELHLSGTAVVYGCLLRYYTAHCLTNSRTMG